MMFLFYFIFNFYLRISFIIYHRYLSIFSLFKNKLFFNPFIFFSFFSLLFTSRFFPLLSVPILLFHSHFKFIDVVEVYILTKIFLHLNGHSISNSFLLLSILSLLMLFIHSSIYLYTCLFINLFIHLLT